MLSYQVTLEAVKITWNGVEVIIDDEFCKNKILVHLFFILRNYYKLQN